MKAALSTSYNANHADNEYELVRARIPGEKNGHNHTRHAWRQRGHGGRVYVVHNVAYCLDGQYIQRDGQTVTAETPRERWYSTIQLASMERARQRRLRSIGLRLDRHMAALGRQWKRSVALAASRAMKALNEAVRAARQARQWMRLASVPTMRRNVQTGRLTVVRRE